MYGRLPEAEIGVYPLVMPLTLESAAYHRPADRVGASTPCGAVSIRRVAIFIPGWSELYTYGGISDLEMGPFYSRLRRNLDGFMAGMFLFSTNFLGKSHWRLAGILQLNQRPESIYNIILQQQGLLDRCEDCLGIDGNAQQATVTARRGTTPGVLLAVSPTLPTLVARRG